MSEKIACGRCGGRGVVRAVAESPADPEYDAPCPDCRDEVGRLREALQASEANLYAAHRALFGGSPAGPLPPAALVLRYLDRMRGEDLPRLLPSEDA